MKLLSFFFLEINLQKTKIIRDWNEKFCEFFTSCYNYRTRRKKYSCGSHDDFNSCNIGVTQILLSIFSLNPRIENREVSFSSPPPLVAYPREREVESKRYFGRLIRIISATCFLSVSSVKQLGSAVTIGFHVPLVSPWRGESTYWSRVREATSSVEWETGVVLKADGRVTRCQDFSYRGRHGVVSDYTRAFQNSQRSREKRITLVLAPKWNDITAPLTRLSVYQFTCPCFPFDLEFYDGNLPPNFRFISFYFWWSKLLISCVRRFSVF